MTKRHTKRTDTSDPDDRFVVSKDLCGPILPYHRSTVWKMVRDGRFPEPVQLSPGRRGWWLSTIRQWAAEREKHPAKARTYFRHDRAPDDSPSP